MSQTPIWDFLKQYQESETIRMHMPGHKGQAPAAFGGDLFPYDITEVAGADSLFDADGIIKQAEFNLSQIYHSRRTLLSAGGSTLCIQAMLAMAAKPGSKVICSRELHHSALNTFVLLDLEPVWLLGRNPDALESLLQAHPDAACVYLTSPNYYGQLWNISAAAKLCKEYGKPLLVDNAHGSHLILFDGLHPMENGAAMCCDSAHKTLPALTGGAFLHIGESQYAKQAKDAMKLFGSTSPSYLILASLDLCTPYLLGPAKAEFSALACEVERLRRLLIGRSYTVPAGPLDPVRLTVGAKELGYTGKELSGYLRVNGVECEYADEEYAVLLPAPCQIPQGLERVKELLLSLPQKKPLPPASHELLDYTLPQRAMSVRDAFFSQKERVSVGNCEGRICTQACSTCPPGIPVVIPGEIISKNLQYRLSFCGICEINVVK